MVGKEDRGQFTYAGAFDNSFADYSDALAGARGAIVEPLVPEFLSDVGIDGPFMGTVGVFDAHAAIVQPLTYPTPRYFGNVSTSQQPVVSTPDPWTVPERDY